MNTDGVSDELTSAQLLAVIAMQTDIAKLGLDLSGVMTLVVERAQHITRATGAAVELVEGEDMVYRAVSGAAAAMLGMRLARASSLSGLCVESAATQRCDDSETDPRVDRNTCRRIGLRSMLVVPLIHMGNTIGALKVFSSQPSAFAAADARVLGLMSDLVAAAMFHATRFGSDELFRQATRDSLTGLANRALFLDRLRHGIARSQRSGARLGVLMLDMDGLKPINDRHGHRAGDAAIREIAQRIGADTRLSDTAARLGGDEFAVLLSTITDRQSAFAAGARINRRCDQPFQFEGQTFHLGVSIGVSVFPENGDRPEILLERADQSMYAVKRLRTTTERRAS